jgi:cation diffusion facilitator family transporter
MTQPPSHLRWPVQIAILAAVLTIGMKGTAYLMTGSIGLLSDALESFVNLAAAVTAYIAIWYSSRPADPTHTYGHEKIEYFSSGLEGVLIFIAGVGVAGYAIKRLLYPVVLNDLEIGTLISLAAAGVNFAAARVMLVQGRKHNSIVLEADGKHLMTDVVTSVGIVIGLGLVVLTGIEWIDPLLGLIVGLLILKTAVELLLRSFNGLMDHALPAEEQDRIREVIRAHLPAGSAFHLLRTRRAGARRFAEFHLLVDGDLTVRAAHHIAHEVEAALVRDMPGLEVTIHIEPVDEQDSWENEEMQRLGEAVSGDSVGPS